MIDPKLDPGTQRHGGWPEAGRTVIPSEPPRLLRSQVPSDQEIAMTNSGHAAFRALLFALLLLGGCKDEDNVTGPAPSDPNSGKTALERLWPNEDGRAWDYAATRREWGYGSGFFQPESLFSTPDSIGTLTLDDVAAFLGNQPIGPGATTSEHIYTIRFNGMMTTTSGAVGQRLESTLSPDTIPTFSPSPLRSTSGGDFLARLAMARPDLRRRIEVLRAAQVPTASAKSVDSPLFLSGWAWARTPEWIGSYGELNTEVAWKYLVANFATGSEFSLQLVPDLASDVFLHARMLPRETIVTESGTYTRAYVCLYLVDYGLSNLTDADGNDLGYFHMYAYGTIAYVTDVGPVYSYERDLVQVGATPDLGAGDWTLKLKNLTPGPSAVASR